MTKPSLQKIDALLPQTQCKNCGFDDCMAYAKALYRGKAAPNLCEVGGENVSKALAKLLSMTCPTPKKKPKPPTIAIIDETCIGCTACIDACPLECISGARGDVHVVIEADCTGCGLCIPPCPMDCIELIKTTPVKLNEDITTRRRLLYNEKLGRKRKKIALKKAKSGSKLDVSKLTPEQRALIEVARKVVQRKLK